MASASNRMKSRGGTPNMKRPKAGKTPIQFGGFGILKKPVPDVSMTPDTFERSQTRIKKKAVRQRRSFDGNATTQIISDETQLSQDNSMLEYTPVTLSQISAINPEENDTLTTTFAKKKRRKIAAADQSNDTMELAVHYARGEPDGAETAADRSFTRKAISKMSLDDGNDSGSDTLQDQEMISEDESSTPSPAKRVKADSRNKSPEKKGGLKEPLKQASKKLKNLKKPGEVQKVKKQVNKSFDALPDETTVPKTPNKTWKEKKQQRKMLKNNYDLIATAKKAWEDLRRADLPAEKRKKICDELMGLLVGKVKQLTKVHDSARVIQCLIQYGTEQQRNAIFDEIQDEICDLCKTKYAKYIVRKLIHYGSKEMKDQVFRRFHGQVRKLIRHKEASEIIEYGFNEYATAPQRLAILEEFYGPTFSMFKDRAHQSLDQIMQDQPEKRDMVIRSMKEALSPLIDKEILVHSLVHKVFYDFFVYADDKAKKEMIEGLRENIPHLLHTRDGTRVAMHCIWSGSVKDRKSIVKSLKTHVVKICKEEHGHMLLLAIFDSVDDTVLVQKVILDEMMKSLEDLMVDQHGRKVLFYLLAPRDQKHFHPDIVKVLQEGDSNPTSKKDKGTRASELLKHASPPLLKYLEANVETMMLNKNLVLLVSQIISHAIGDVAPAMRVIADFVARPSTSTDGAISLVEHPACHIALKKIIANDKSRMEAGEGILFSSILLQALPKSTIKVWAASNRGCFVLVSLLEVGCSTVTEKVVEHIQPVKKSLTKMNFQGAELLKKKLGMDSQREYCV